MRRNIIYIVVIFSLMAFLNFGCNSNLDPTESIGLYTVSGGYIKNLDNDTNVVAVSSLRNSEYYSALDFLLFDSLLTYESSDSTYSILLDSVSLGAYYLLVNDTATGLDDSVLFAVPQNIAAPTTTSLPDGNENPGGADVQIEWLASSGADGYVVAVVPEDSLYTDFGFSEFSPDNNTIYTIPVEAFRPAGGLDPDTGWYNVYVYSYAGSPMTDYNLPFAIPDGLSSNITRANIVGSFGSVVVSPKTRIHVVVSN